MRVRELIARLKLLDQDVHVFVSNSQGIGETVTDVHESMYFPADWEGGSITCDLAKYEDYVEIYAG